MSEKKTPKEQYLDAKWVCDNADKFYYRDVALAREFVDGFEAALQVARGAVGEELRINLWGPSRQAVKDVLARIESKLTEDE